VFVNTRRLVERVARHLSERLGEENVARITVVCPRSAPRGGTEVEGAANCSAGGDRLAELGIDIGDVDLVCQLARHVPSTPSCSGWAVQGIRWAACPRPAISAVPGRIGGVRGAAGRVRRGELDRLRIPLAPLDVLSQQITAEVSAREWQRTSCSRFCALPIPTANSRREEFDECVHMLAEGFSTRRGPPGALLHHDSVNKMLRLARARGCGAHIRRRDPRQRRLQGDAGTGGHLVGTVNEDLPWRACRAMYFSWATRPTGYCGGTQHRARGGRSWSAAVHPFWLGEARAH